jgi:indolepyruvate ferredoxin oxidoreductase alpha subunit
MPAVETLSLKSDSPGARLFLLGNEAIARGAIEAGVQVMGAYPGTPSTEIAEALINVAKDFGFYAEWSVNEKVAFGVAMGASICGLRSLSVMKHVGVNVALDLVVTAAYLGARGGLVLVEAEDPGQWSSSDEQDNRFLAEEAYLPILEPSSAQEAKDMTRDAFRLSEEFGQPFVIRSVTRIGHARGDVTLGEISRLKRPGTFTRDPSQWVMLPAVAKRHRRAMVARLAKIKSAVDSWPYNQLKTAAGSRLGVITAGISHAYAMEALSWLGLQERVAMLKIGTPYPLPEKLVAKLLGSVEEVLVVEELEPYLENHIKAVAQSEGLGVKIHGKDLLPVVGELSTRKVSEALSRLSGVRPPLDFALIDARAEEAGPLLPLRPPAMCAGCPHRASHYALNLAVERIKKATGVEPIRPGDIGCYCLGANEPLSAVDTSTCMGSGFDLASGMARALDTPIVAHLGDSTFFHSGIGPMINAVFNQTRMTMVVLDNLTTAMTGSQPNPGVGSNACNPKAPQIRPEDIARAAGVKFVEVLNPYDLEQSVEILVKAINFSGPSVVVFRSPCAIVEQREKRARGEKSIPCQIDQSKCLQKTPPFCSAACPLQLDARGYVELAREGKYTESLKLIKEKLPFPAILGRICTHPCESKCKRSEVEDAIAIMALKRAAAEYGKSEEEKPPEVERQEKVAIVGGGPAGLMAAYDLRKLGYRTTVFEAAPFLGGMLSLGIPEYRLPRQVLRKELSLIEKLGATVKLNTRVGRDLDFARLQAEYQAVFLATGAHRGRDAGIAGADARGLFHGVDFLRALNTGEKVEIGRSAVIIGGGNVAIDCARSCLRLGLPGVTIVYRRSRGDMPAIKEEVAAAEEEGVKFYFNASPARVMSQGGQVTGLECLKMSPGEPDASGRRRPLPVAGSEFVLETGSVILATGEQPDLTFLDGGRNSPAAKNGLLLVDPASLLTSVRGIFAGGDVVTGPRSVIDALAAGRQAAASIDLFLRGEPLPREVCGPGESKLEVSIRGIKAQPRLPMPKRALANLPGESAEVERGYSREDAMKEAARCLSCGCKACIKALGCPAISLEGDEVVIDSSQCPGCGICAQVCPAEAIK